MKCFAFTLLLLVCGLPGSAQSPSAIHRPWTELLHKHVNSDGRVSYKGFVADSAELNRYLNTLSAKAPDNDWSREQKLAYWINVYNAFTVKLILDHYPVSSIKDIKRGIPFLNSVWDMKFFEIVGERMDLNEVEHQILRKEFDEPRIHFALVCASRSCPKLRNEAYTAEKLEQQLDEQAVDFINDRSKNRFEEEEIQLSPIFSWFEKDFTRKMTLKEYIRQYAKRDFGSYAKVKFLDYDWSLNGE